MNPRYSPHSNLNAKKITYEQVVSMTRTKSQMSMTVHSKSPYLTWAWKSQEDEEYVKRMIKDIHHHHHHPHQDDFMF